MHLLDEVRVAQQNSIQRQQKTHIFPQIEYYPVSVSSNYLPPYFRLKFKIFKNQQANHPSLPMQNNSSGVMKNIQTSVYSEYQNPLANQVLQKWLKKINQDPVSPNFQYSLDRNSNVRKLNSRTGQSRGSLNHALDQFTLGQIDYVSSQANEVLDTFPSNFDTIKSPDKIFETINVQNKENFSFASNGSFTANKETSRSKSYINAMKALQEKFRGLELERQKLQAEKNKIQEQQRLKNIETESIIAKYEDKCAHLSKQLEDKTLVESELNARIVILERSQQNMEKIVVENTKLKESKARKDKKLKHAEHYIQQLAEKYTSAVRGFEGKCDQHQQLEDQYEQLQKKFDGVCEKVKNHEELIQFKDSQLQKLRQQCEEKSQKMREAQYRYDMLDKENRRIQDEQKNSSNEVSSIHSQFTSLAAEFRNKCEETDRLKKQLDRHQAEVGEWEAQRRQLTQKVKEVTKELEQMKQDYDNLLDDYHRVKKLYERAPNNNNNILLKDMVSEYQQNIEELSSVHHQCQHVRRDSLGFNPAASLGFRIQQNSIQSKSAIHPNLGITEEETTTWKETRRSTIQGWDLTTVMLIEAEKEALQLYEQQERLLSISKECISEADKAEYLGRLKQLNDQIRANTDKLFTLKDQESTSSAAELHLVA